MTDDPTAPLDPVHEKSIRDLANTYAEVPSYHVWRLLQEIERLREELSTAQTDLAAGRAKMLRDIAVDMISGRLAVFWDERICAKVLEQGPFAFAAYAQIHIAESLRREAEADLS